MTSASLRQAQLSQSRANSGAIIGPEKAGGSSGAIGAAWPDGREFKGARMLYYLGMGTIALEALRPFAGFNVSDWFFFGSLTVLIGTLAVTHARLDAHLPRLLVFGFALFSLGALFTLPVAFHPTDSIASYARFAFIVTVWFVLGAMVLRTRRQVEIATAAWIFSNAISGGAAVAQTYFGRFLFAAFTTVPLDASNVGYWGRQIGLSGHPNDLGGAAAIVVAPGLIFATILFATSRQKLWFTGLVCLVLAGIALSGSVTAYVAAFPGVALLVILGRVATGRLVLIAGALLATSVGLILVNNLGASTVLSPLDRVSMTMGWTDATFATGPERLSVDAVAWNEIGRSPLYGVGLDGDSVAQALGGVAVHNMFLFVWVGAGVFGLLGLLILIISIGNSLVEEFRLATFDTRSLTIAIGTSFLSFLIVTLAQPILFVRWGWAPATLLLSLRAIRIRGESKAALGHLVRVVPDGGRAASVHRHI